MKVLWIEGEEKIGLVLRKLNLEKSFEKGERIAIKLHMGVKGNPNYVSPTIVRKIVEFMRSLGTKPFLFDTNALYPQRKELENCYEIVRRNGFSEDEIGCPVIIGSDGIKVKTGDFLGEVEVAKELVRSQGMIVLSHLKGHSDAGFGGAIKNLGMGGVTNETKARMHDGGRPRLKGECELCMTCVKNCPFDAMVVKDKPKVNYDRCFGCGICIRVCPSKVLAPKVALLTTLLAEGAKAVLSRFERGKVVFVNVLQRITQFCDCLSNPGPILCDDIGILFSKDLIAIERASIDLVNKKAKRNLFKEENKIDPQEQIDAALKLGLGQASYKLIKI
jgi:hypothetical protein